MSIGEGVLDVSCDDRRRLLVVRIEPHPLHQTHHLGRPRRSFLESPEHLVFTVGQPSGQLLDHEHALVVDDEDHWMTMDPGRHLDQTLMDPVVDRLVPGEIEELRVARPDQEMWGAHPETLWSAASGRSIAV